MNNKKMIKKTIIILAILTALLLIFGLIFIASSNLYIPIIDDITGKIITYKVSGFEALRAFGLDTVLSNSLLEWFLLPNSQLGLLKCGIVFSVILAPLLFGFAILVSGYYYVKFIQKEKTSELIDASLNVEEESKNIVTEEVQND